MAKYLLLKHYQGAPQAINCVPMDQWSPEEVDAHMKFMWDFAARLEGSGEYVEGQALAPTGMWVRSDGAGKTPVTDGPFAETKDLIAGWMVIDVDSEERAIELAADLSSAPGAGGDPIHEWIELRPFLEAPPTVHRMSHGGTVVTAEIDTQVLRALAPEILNVLVRRGADFATAEDAVQEAS